MSLFSLLCVHHRSPHPVFFFVCVWAKASVYTSIVSTFRPDFIRMDFMGVSLGRYARSEMSSPEFFFFGVFMGCVSKSIQCGAHFFFIDRSNDIWWNVWPRQFNYGKHICSILVGLRRFLLFVAAALVVASVIVFVAIGIVVVVVVLATVVGGWSALTAVTCAVAHNTNKTNKNLSQSQLRQVSKE